MKDGTSVRQQDTDGKRSENTSQGKKDKQLGTTRIGLIVGIIAAVILLIFGFSPIGVILAVLAVCLIMPELIKVIKDKKLPENNAGVFLAGTAISIIAIIISIVSTINMMAKENANKKPEIQQEYSNLEKLDLNGFTINEACAKLREAGWRIAGVSNGYLGDKSELSDCSDTTHRVSTVSYRDKKYSEYTGEENKEYESAFIEFNSDSSKNASSSTNSNATSNDSSSTSSSSTTTVNNDNTSKSSSSNSSEWKQFLKDYEAWANSYVNFMKKYKNASSSELPSMLNDYTDMMNKALEWSKRAEGIKGSISTEDMAEYLQTLSRITQKLSEI